MVKPKIIFIFGSGHSGSTLLDMILGSSENAFSVGELRQWNRYFHKQDKFRNSTQVYNFCTCGAKIEECPFWNKINNKHEKDLDNEKGSKIEMLALSSGRKPLKDINVPEKDYLDVYKQIQRQIGQDKWIVDSSKEVYNLLRLLKFWDRGDIDLKIIGIKKNCSGVIYSHYKLPETSWVIQYLGWIYNYIFAYNLIKISGAPHYMIRYEDLITNIQKYIKEISDFTRLSIETPLRLNNKTFHNIGGNKIRFNKVENIYLDERWKKELGFFKKNLGKITNFIVEHISGD